MATASKQSDCYNVVSHKGQACDNLEDGPYPHCSPEAPLGTTPSLTSVCVQTSDLSVFLFSLHIKVTVWIQKDLHHFSPSHSNRDFSLSSIPLTKEGLKPAVLKGSIQVVGDTHGDCSYSLVHHQILFHTLLSISP